MRGEKFKTDVLLIHCQADSGRSIERFSNRENFGLLKGPIGTAGVSLIPPSQVLGAIDARRQFQDEANHPSILKRLQEAHEIARRILKKMGALEVVGSTGPVCAASAIGQHGSCRAGADRRNSVVNSDFESHEVENLFT